jgi:RNA recognition motif-containing protein
MMVIDFSGRFNGEAFVQFETISDAHKALERHKQKISNRFVGIFIICLVYFLLDNFILVSVYLKIRICASS